MSSMPQATASSTTYWMAGRSTTGSISLGTALVTGRNRVPRPAAGITALRTVDVMSCALLRVEGRRAGPCGADAPTAGAASGILIGGAGPIARNKDAGGRGRIGTWGAPHAAGFGP